jgi:hypothetical protein
VIHPLLPERIPCYDLTLIAEFALVPQKKCEVSGTPDFADLTGSVCKRRERIHRSLLICDYYQFQVHAGELQPAIPTEDCFGGLAPPCGLATLCTVHCRMCVALDISVMLT